MAPHPDERFAPMNALIAERPTEIITRGAAAEAQPPTPPDGERTATERLRELATICWPVLLVAAALCAVTFLATGGLNLGPMTTVAIALTIGCGAAIAAIVALAPASRFGYGSWAAGLLLAFAALSALSIVWSVQPDASWQAASRLFAYSGVFALAVLLARIAPRHWSAVLGGALLACVVVCGYALLTKVFPNRLGSEQVVYYARLREPYGYWNATGLCAALGAVCCLWLGARRSGHALLSALAYPALGIMLVTLMLAYSRGALVAFALGAALWLCLVPLRLRGATVLLVAALGAGIVVAWDFSRTALTTDTATLPTRIAAGHQLGVLLAAVLLALTLAGVAIEFLGGRRAPSPTTRRRAGTVLLALPALAVIALVLALAVSHRGLFGSISHGLGSLTNPNASVPANGPARLTAIGSARARYWKEALQVFEAHPLAGAGAEGYATARLRYRTAPLKVQQAHGFVVQTLADLGTLGLLVVLALFAAWAAAAGRATHPFNRRWSGWRWHPWPTVYTPERIGLLTMLCLVVTFGLHSFVDWTWYVPGIACTALLCAGWLAGRGPLQERGQAEERGPLRAHDSLASARTARRTPSTPPAPRRTIALGGRALDLSALDPWALGTAAVVLAVALLAAWAEWQPQRSQSASNQALALLARSPAAALAAAHTAVDRDPLSAEALITLAAVQQAAGERPAAAATYAKAVHVQPSNWQTWEALGEYDLAAGNPRAALEALRAAVYLNPQAIAPPATINEELLALQHDYLRALRATATTPQSRAATTPQSRAAAAPQKRAPTPSRKPAAVAPQKRARRAPTSSTRRAPGTPPSVRVRTS